MNTIILFDLNAKEKLEIQTLGLRKNRKQQMFDEK